MAFILVHSLQGNDVSWAESNAAAVLLEPVLEGVFGLSGKVAVWLGLATPMGFRG